MAGKHIQPTAWPAPRRGWASGRAEGATPSAKPFCGAGDQRTVVLVDGLMEKTEVVT